MDPQSAVTGNDFALSLAAAGRYEAAEHQFLARGGSA